MKRASIVGVLLAMALVGVLMCCGCARSRLSTGQRVTDLSKTMSVEVPKGWKQRPSPGTLSALILMGPAQEGFEPNLTVMVGDAGKVTLALLEEGTMKSLSSNRGYHPISKKNRKLDGVDAKAIEYTVDGGFAGKKLHYQMVFTVRNGKAYYITCTSLDRYYSKNLEAFNFMLDSVKWEK